MLRGRDTLIPSEDTCIEEGDRVIIASRHEDEADMMLGEIMVGPKSEWIGEKISAVASRLNVSCVLIKRDGKSMTADNDTVIRSRDSLVVFRRNNGGRM